jgi:hypothetical protein
MEQSLTQSIDSFICISYLNLQDSMQAIEENEWRWSTEIEPSGELTLYLNDEDLVYWSHQANGETTFYSQEDYSLNENIRDVMKNFAGNTNNALQIICLGFPAWEDELELGTKDIYDFGEGDGVGSEISVKKHNAFLKKNPRKLLCVTRQIYEGPSTTVTKETLENEPFIDNFEPIDYRERSSFIVHK